MAGIVSQYQQGAFSDLSNGTVADATVVLSNDNATRGKHNSHDADATIHVQSSLVANRPAAATAQRLWLSTDTGGVFLALDTGAAWVDINYIRTTATSLPASVLASSLTSVGVLAAPHMTAPVIDSGGMTISSGTLAAQAVTATTGTFSNAGATALTVGGSANASTGISVDAVSGTAGAWVQFKSSGVVKWLAGRGPATASDNYEIYDQAGSVLAFKITTNSGAITTGASVAVTGAFGCNGNAVQTKQVSGGTLAGVIAALVATGILSS